MEPIVTLQNGMRLCIDQLDSLDLTKTGTYETIETEYIRSFVKPDMTVVDIGANIGYYTILMACYANHVLALEPDPDNYKLLLRNIELNDLSDKVTALNYAVGPGQADITLYKCSINNGMHRTYKSKWCLAGKENVHMVQLDSIIIEPHFIKMDIEGAEYGALLGMERILKEVRPTILMEFNTPSIVEYGKEPRQVYDYIISMGYDISLPDKPITWEELEAFTSKWAGINILCTPTRK